MKLKQLQEQAGAKKKEIRAYLDKASADKRVISSDDADLRRMESEFDSINSTLEAEVRQFARESQKSPLEGMSEGERRDIGRFDYGKLLRGMEAQAKGIAGHRIDGIEAELVADGEKEARDAGINGAGIHLPRALVQKRAVTATGQTSVAGDQGGQTIQTNVNGLLDAFYNALVLPKLGATFLTGLTSNFNWPRYVKGADAAGLAENATASASNPTISSIAFAPQRIATYIDISQQLLIQSNEAIEAVLRRNVQQQASVLFQKYVINGAGHGSNQPQGILGVSGIGSVAGGTNGANPLWKHIVQLKSKVATADALVGSLGYMINSATESQLSTQLKNDATGTDSRYIIDPDLNPGKLAGYQYALTNSVPSNLTKGTASGICSAIIFGNWSDLVVATWGGLTLELVRDVAGAKAGQYTLVLNMYGDSNIVRSESFSAMKDALTPNA